jgi:hypothetical protein
MTPRRKALTLALLSLGAAAVLVPAVYVGYQATIGSHVAGNQCDATPPGDRLAMHAVGHRSRQRWRWWRPGYDVTCLYEMPDGSTVARRAK